MADSEGGELLKFFLWQDGWPCIVLCISYHMNWEETSRCFRAIHGWTLVLLMLVASPCKTGWPFGVVSG